MVKDRIIIENGICCIHTDTIKLLIILKKNQSEKMQILELINIVGNTHTNTHACAHTQRVRERLE